MAKASSSKSTKGRKTQPAAARTTRAKPAAKKPGKARAKPAKRAPVRKKPDTAPAAADVLRAERDELRAALAEAQSRLAEFKQQAEELAALREEVESARGELAASRERLAEAEVEAEEAADELASGPPAQPHELPVVIALPPEERADDVRDRLVHFLNDAWSIEKEQAGLLQTLADESGDRDVRAILEEYRAAAERQQAALEARLEALGAQASGGRGLLGQLVTRVWDAMQKPRDQADAAVQALLKAVSAAECEAGAYAAVNAFARMAGDDETAELAARHYGHERERADRLRAAIPRAVERAARR